MRLNEILERWAQRQPSEIQSHEGECCKQAKAWFTSMANSALAIGGAPQEPAWIVERYKWGPCEWPMHWCEAMTAEAMDCGAFAAVGRFLMEASGVSTCPVQLVERYSVDDGAHWSALWAARGCGMDWSEEGLTYHEATGVVSEGSLRVWDSTRGVWRASSETQGYGSIAAIRCWLPRESSVSWGMSSLKSGLWCELA